MEYSIHQYDLTIKEHHLDTFGHVNNATYLQIYEEARWEMITERGFGLSTIRKTGLGPVILEINIKFIKELRLRQNITIHSQTVDFSGKIGKVKQWITDQEENICSEITLVLGLFDTKERKLVEPNEAWLNAIR